MITEAQAVGLQVSEEKMEYLTLARNGGSRVGQNITMDDLTFELEQSFKNLGSILNVSNDLEEALETRITTVSKCFYALKHLFKTSLLNRSTKLNLNESLTVLTNAMKSENKRNVCRFGVAMCRHCNT